MENMIWSHAKINSTRVNRMTEANWYISLKETVSAGHYCEWYNSSKNVKKSHNHYVGIRKACLQHHCWVQIYEHPDLNITKLLYILFTMQQAAKI